MQTDSQQKKLLRRPKVEQLTGLGRSSIYALMKEGSFPQSVSLGRRAVAWVEEEIVAWIDERINARHA
jgi:prophage regulatory protein